MNRIKHAPRLTMTFPIVFVTVLLITTRFSNAYRITGPTLHSDDKLLPDDDDLVFLGSHTPHHDEGNQHRDPIQNVHTPAFSEYRHPWFPESHLMEEHSDKDVHDPSMDEPLSRSLGHTGLSPNPKAEFHPVYRSLTGPRNKHAWPSSSERESVLKRGLSSVFPAHPKHERASRERPSHSPARFPSSRHRALWRLNRQRPIHTPSGMQNLVLEEKDHEPESIYHLGHETGPEASRRFGPSWSDSFYRPKYGRTSQNREANKPTSSSGRFDPSRSLYGSYYRTRMPLYPVVRDTKHQHMDLGSQMNAGEIQDDPTHSYQYANTDLKSPPAHASSEKTKSRAWSPVNGFPSLDVAHGVSSDHTYHSNNDKLRDSEPLAEMLTNEAGLHEDGGHFQKAASVQKASADSRMWAKILSLLMLHSARQEASADSTGYPVPETLQHGHGGSLDESDSVEKQHLPPESGDFLMNQDLGDKIESWANSGDLNKHAIGNGETSSLHSTEYFTDEAVGLKRPSEDSKKVYRSVSAQPSANLAGHTVQETAADGQWVELDKRDSIEKQHLPSESVDSIRDQGSLEKTEYSADFDYLYEDEIGKGDTPSVESVEYFEDDPVESGQPSADFEGVHRGDSEPSADSAGYPLPINAEEEGRVNVDKSSSAESQFLSSDSDDSLMNQGLLERTGSSANSGELYKDVIGNGEASSMDSMKYFEDELTENEQLSADSLDVYSGDSAEPSADSAEYPTPERAEDEDQANVDKSDSTEKQHLSLESADSIMDHDLDEKSESLENSGKDEVGYGASSMESAEDFEHEAVEVEQPSADSVDTYSSDSDENSGDSAGYPIPGSPKAEDRLNVDKSDSVENQFLSLESGKPIMDQELSESGDSIMDQELSESGDSIMDQELSESRDSIMDQELSESRDSIMDQELSESGHPIMDQGLSDSGDSKMDHGISDSGDSKMDQGISRKSESLSNSGDLHTYAIRNGEVSSVESVEYFEDEAVDPQQRSDDLEDVFSSDSAELLADLAGYPVPAGLGDEHQAILDKSDSADNQFLSSDSDDSMMDQRYPSPERADNEEVRVDKSDSTDNQFFSSDSDDSMMDRDSSRKSESSANSDDLYKDGTGNAEASSAESAEYLEHETMGREQSSADSVDDDSGDLEEEQGPPADTERFWSVEERSEEWKSLEMPRDVFKGGNSGSRGSSELSKDNVIEATETEDLSGESEASVHSTMVEAKLHEPESGAFDFSDQEGKRELAGESDEAEEYEKPSADSAGYPVPGGVDDKDRVNLDKSDSVENQFFPSESDESMMGKGSLEKDDFYNDEIANGDAAWVESVEYFEVEPVENEQHSADSEGVYSGYSVEPSADSEGVYSGYSVEPSADSEGVYSGDSVESSADSGDVYRGDSAEPSADSEGVYSGDSSESSADSTEYLVPGGLHRGDRINLDKSDSAVKRFLSSDLDDSMIDQRYIPERADNEEVRVDKSNSADNQFFSSDSDDSMMDQGSSKKSEFSANSDDFHRDGIGNTKTSSAESEEYLEQEAVEHEEPSADSADF